MESATNTLHTSFLPCFALGMLTWGAALEGKGVSGDALGRGRVQEERGWSSPLCLHGSGRGGACGFQSVFIAGIGRAAPLPAFLGSFHSATRSRVCVHAQLTLC